MNVSIHTYRPWDQGKRRPARLEQVQLLALIVEAPIDVIWPATDDPLVAEALRLERQRETATREPTARDWTPDTSPPDADDEPGEIRVRRLERAPVGSGGAKERTRDTGSGIQAGGGVDEPGPANHLGGLPPWPEETGEEPPGEPIPTGAAVVTGTARAENQERLPEAFELVQDRSVVDHDGEITLRAAAAGPGRRLKRVIVALAAALALGGVGTVVASELSEKSADADPTAQTAPVEMEERARVEARARDVATMRAVADRGDYDAAIAQARQLDDPAAMSGYRESAARVLVGRADKAARRGDLPLARSRLRAATRRYGIAPGAAAVQARVRRIERQRKERAGRQRAAARRAAAVAAQQRAAANAARASEPSVSNAPAPSTSSAPQPSAPTPSSSSKGSGGGSGGKKAPEEAVDPGLF